MDCETTTLSDGTVICHLVPLPTLVPAETTTTTVPDVLPMTGFDPVVGVVGTLVLILGAALVRVVSPSRK
jgi:hypothetical protein